MTNVLTPNDLECARAFCAVNDEHGRDENDPFYQKVTEGRGIP